MYIIKFIILFNNYAFNLCTPLKNVYKLRRVQTLDNSIITDIDYLFSLLHQVTLHFATNLTSAIIPRLGLTVCANHITIKLKNNKYIFYITSYN